MKLGQKVCQKNIRLFENGSGKNLVTRSNLKKVSVLSEGHIFNSILMKFGQNIYLNKISYEFKNLECRVKYRSLGQIFRKNLLYALEAIFSVRYS